MKTILPAVLFAAFATTSAWAAESVQPLEKIAPYPQAEKRDEASGDSVNSARR